MRDRRDIGFTLPELLICVVIMGTIVTVMSSVVTAVLRSTPDAEARAEDARSVMGLVTWLPQDIDSTPPTGFNQDPAVDSGCDQSPGTNLLRLQWSENVGTFTTYIAGYRYVEDGGVARVQRVRCSGTGAPPYTGATVQNLTSDLPPLPVGWTSGQAPANVQIVRADPLDATSDVELVTFELTMIDGGIVRTDSAPKNPANTLPATTLPSWYPPTPITLVETNSLPTTSDQAFTAHPDVVTTSNIVVYDADGDTLVVDVATAPPGWVVTMTGLAMSVQPPLSDVGTVGTITFSVDDLRGDGIVTGQVLVEVVPATTPTTTSTTSTTSTSTTTTTTLPPCVVNSASASPSPVKNVQPDSQNQGGGNVNVGVLEKKVTITATTNTFCDGLEARYSSGGVNSPPFIGMNQTSETTWTLTLLGRDDGSSETWADGTHTIQFYSSRVGGPWGSVDLKVN